MNPSQADDVRVGSVLGGTYELTSLLGEGGMGYVFAARHLRLPKQVAVKVLKTGFSLSPDIVARFRREAEIASRLGHPHIVEVLDFDTLPSGTPFLVLEFLKGESLGQRIARGPLAWEETREIALQCGSALLAAHGAGVVHRDLKPDNIFLLPGDSAGTTRHRVKLLDFGISKLSGGNTVQTQDSILMGTPRYMSPEQALGKNAAIDARSDVFALACIYYEMLAGQAAFPGDNIPTVLYRIVHEMPRPLAELVSGLPPHVWPALERAFSKEAGQRTPDVTTLTEALTGTRLFARGDAASPALPAGAAEISTLEVLDATYVPPSPTPPPASAGTDALGATYVPGAGASVDATFVPQPASPPVSITLPPPADADAAPAPAPPVPSSGLPRAALGAAAVVLLVAGAALFRTRAERTPPASPAPPPLPELTAPVQPVPPAPAPPTAHSAPPPQATPPQATPQAVEALPAQLPEARKPVRKEPVPRAPAPDLEPTLPRAIEELELAEKALAAGKGVDAQFRAGRSLTTQHSGKALSVLIRAHCSVGDLSRATADFRRVPRELQTECLSFCARFDIDLKAASK